MEQDWGAYRLVESVRQQDALRSAFNRLANEIFGLDFEPWYQKGFWTDSYQPFTLFEGDRAIANVSANRFTLVINGKRQRAVQFGTVMTHPDYRGQGLASRLMRHAMDKLRTDCDLFYLMGDKDALDFYRKLGFEAIPQTACKLRMAEEIAGSTGSAAAASIASSKGCGRWLDFTTREDLELLQRMAAVREPVSLRVGVLDAIHLLHFYIMNGYGDKCWHIPASAAGDQDLIVIFGETDGVLTLHDVLFSRPVPLARLLELVPHGDVSEITFGFVPDRLSIRSEEGILLAEPMDMEDAFFVIPAEAFGPEPFLYPPIGLA